MKVILVTKNKEKIEHEINDKDLDVGVIIRQDSRKNPPVRVFNYVSKPNFHWHIPPEFHESDYVYVDEKGLHDDKWNDDGKTFP
jgi:hypothetical protein